MPPILLSSSKVHLHLVSVHATLDNLYNCHAKIISFITFRIYHKLTFDKNNHQKDLEFQKTALVWVSKVHNIFQLFWLQGCPLNLIKYPRAQIQPAVCFPNPMIRMPPMLMTCIGYCSMDVNLLCASLIYHCLCLS